MLPEVRVGWVERRETQRFGVLRNGYVGVRFITPATRAFRHYRPNLQPD